MLLSFGVFALAILGLAVGVLAGRPPIAGSCGGSACGKTFACGSCPHRGPEDAP